MVVYIWYNLGGLILFGPYGDNQEQYKPPIECAKREVREEIGVFIHCLTELFQGEFKFWDTKRKGYFYFVDSVSGTQAINELEKFKGIRLIHNINVVNFSVEFIEITQQLVEYY
ncbi:NUDIX hydrolase [Bacillus salitolerans]|uniref:NUDIX hydrolase n=1 Tax=Bacillus salitolerans TaxID=1437434 RepID=A0ABW4LVX2_9BACI